MYDGAHKRLQKLDSFDANLNSTKRKLDSTKRKLDSFDANLNSTKRKLDSFHANLTLFMQTWRVQLVFPVRLFTSNSSFYESAVRDLRLCACSLELSSRSRARSRTRRWCLNSLTLNSLLLLRNRSGGFREFAFVKTRENSAFKGNSQWFQSNWKLIVTGLTFSVHYLTCWTISVLRIH